MRAKNIPAFCRFEENSDLKETEFDSRESKVASTLETRLFNLICKIKIRRLGKRFPGNMAKITNVMQNLNLHCRVGELFPENRAKITLSCKIKICRLEKLFPGNIAKIMFVMFSDFPLQKKNNSKMY